MINQNYKSFLTILWNNILTAYQKLFHIQYTVITASEIQTAVRKVFPNLGMGLFDEKYQLAPWTFWLDFIQYDWTEKKKYIADFYDCDNYSGSFCARAAEIFNLNSAGRFSCNVTLPNGNYLPHRAVIIVAVDEVGNVACYVYESQNDGWQKVVTPSQTIKIGSWTYKGTFCEFN
jgi:hypothetical protein